MSTTTPVAASAGASASGTQSRASSLTSASDQEDRFMKLLVAQMKNQDPLNPMDNAQMTSQIAQINTVGGIEKLNATVESLLAAFTRVQSQSAVDLAGHDVLIAGTQLSLDAGAARGGVELSGAADSVIVDIVGADGATVRTIALGASPVGARSFSWDGSANDGMAAPDGDYRMRVTATRNGQAVAAQTLTRVHVQSVANGDAGVQLDLGSAGVKPLSDVRSYL